MMIFHKKPLIIIEMFGFSVPSLHSLLGRRKGTIGGRWVYLTFNLLLWFYFYFFIIIEIFGLNGFGYSFICGGRVL